MTITAKEAQVQGLATLLVLNDELHKLNNIREFSFFVTNETHRLIPYHTTYLWEPSAFIGSRLLAQSGVAELDIHAPANQWVLEQINKQRMNEDAAKIHPINFDRRKRARNDDGEWPEALPHYGLWCPFLNKQHDVTGGLIFFRDYEFTQDEVKMIGWLNTSYQYTWDLVLKPKNLSMWQKIKKKPYLKLASLFLLLILLFPIHLSVLAVATVVPKDPVLINAPMQGVIQSFAVSPGENVTKGQLLVTLDKTDLLASAEVSKKDFELTQTKLRTFINEGMTDSKSRAEIPVLQAQLAIDKSRLDYTTELLAKADIQSPIDGLVVFDSKEDWIGQPVQTGERILTISDPKQVQLKISLAVADVIQLSPGDKGEFFLAGQLSGIDIELYRLGYNAKLMPNKILAYQLMANFTDPKEIPQLGATGSARLYGKRVPLIYYLLRRPLQAMRQNFGI